MFIKHGLEFVFNLTRCEFTTAVDGCVVQVTKRGLKMWNNTIVELRCIDRGGHGCATHSFRHMRLAHVLANPSVSVLLSWYTLKYTTVSSLLTRSFLRRTSGCNVLMTSSDTQLLDAIVGRVTVNVVHLILFALYRIKFFWVVMSVHAHMHV